MWLNNYALCTKKKPVLVWRHDTNQKTASCLPHSLLHLWHLFFLFLWHNPLISFAFYLVLSTLSTRQQLALTANFVKCLSWNSPCYWKKSDVLMIRDTIYIESTINLDEIRLPGDFLALWKSLSKDNQNEKNLTRNWVHLFAQWWWSNLLFQTVLSAKSVGRKLTTTNSAKSSLFYVFFPACR